MTSPMDHPTPRHARDKALEQRINRAVLSDPDSIQRWRTDLATHLQIEQLRMLLLVADKAMEAEGVGRDARDRVVHWILVGEPAPRWDPDPDAELGEAVRRTMAERRAWVEYLEKLPIEVPPLLDGP